MFKIPADIPALDDDALAQAVADARAALKGADYDNISDEDLTEAEKVADFIAQATAEQGTREEVDAARQARIDKTKAAADGPEDDEKEDEVEEVDAEKEAEAVAAAVEETEKVAAAARALAASARRPVTRRAVTRAPKVETQPEIATVALTAAADVPGYSTGSTLDTMDDLAKATVARMKGLPKTRIGGPDGVFQRYGLATITKPRVDGLTQADVAAYRTDQELVAAAGTEERLPEQSLTAAGGWCAPSQTLYDLTGDESLDGLIDLPEMNITRGGINFTKGPQFGDFYSSGMGFHQTEAQAIAGTVKPCIEVACPDFTEVRLDARGVCIKAGILTNVGYPELVRRTIEGVLTAHQHATSLWLITQIENMIGAATSVANVFPHAISVLDALELVAEGERQRIRMSMRTTMEVLLPFWVKAAIRADLANRTGVDMLTVSDQQIIAHFTARKLRVQWLYNWQPLTLTGAAGVGPAIDYPSTVSAILYPAGTYVKGTTDVITLDAVYDSTMLETNTYTALFTEEGILVANRKNQGQRVTIPLAITGMTAAAAINDDWGTAQTPGSFL